MNAFMEELTVVVKRNNDDFNKLISEDLKTISDDVVYYPEVINHKWGDNPFIVYSDNFIYISA